MYGNDTEGTVLTLLQNNRNYIKNTHMQDDKCQGYDLFFPKSGSTIMEKNIVASQQNINDYRPEPRDRYHLLQILKKTEENINLMIEGIEENDPLVVASNGIDFLDNLEKLWKLRKIRNENWATLLNFLQSALSSIHLENLTKNQIVSIKKIFTDSLFSGGTKKSDIEKALMMLEDVNLDPWMGISSE